MACYSTIEPIIYTQIHTVAKPTNDSGSFVACVSFATSVSSVICMAIAGGEHRARTDELLSQALMM